MKVHWYWRRWLPVTYGLTNLGKFMFWSNFVLVDGSQKVVGRDAGNYGPGAMNWLRKKLNWPECVILDPIARPDATYIMGFTCPEKKLCLVAPFSAARRVSQGPFAMRLGPKPINFFIVGTARLNLELIGHITRGTADDKAAKDIVIY